MISVLKLDMNVGICHCLKAMIEINTLNLSTKNCLVIRVSALGAH